MIYTVVWIKSAERQLITLYNLAGPDRQAIADSANRIDQELRVDPDSKGIPWGHLSAYYDDPLVVLYQVDPGDCMVRVLAVRRII